MKNAVALWCIFGWRSGEDSPELLDAWDEFAVDANWDGWIKAGVKAARDNDIRPELIRTAHVVIDWDRVESLYHNQEIEGEVRATQT